MLFLSFIPSIILLFSNREDGSGFVNISAACAWLSTCSNSTFPSFTCSRMKWKRTSMCMLLSWLTKFFANSMVDLLSTRITVPFSCFNSSFLKRFLRQTAWQTLQDAATYFTSHVDSVTMGCFFESQVNVVLPIIPREDKIINIKGNEHHIFSFLLYVKSMFIRALLIPILLEVSVDSFIPCSWSFLQAIKCLLQSQDFLLFASSHVSKWLFNIYFLLQDSIQKCWLHIHLQDCPSVLSF